MKKVLATILCLLTLGLFALIFVQEQTSAHERYFTGMATNSEPVIRNNCIPEILEASLFSS